MQTPIIFRYCTKLLLRDGTIYSMNYLNSPIQELIFNKQKYFVIRDDLLNPDFSGNKARKFYYYLINDFPNIKKVVSHGSSQSNAM